MESGLKSLNASILENPKVKIVGLKKGKTKRGNKETRIKISPSKPQKSPVNLKALQQTIKRHWQRHLELTSFCLCTENFWLMKYIEPGPTLKLCK